VRDRIKTDRRDSLKLAGLARAGELIRKISGANPLWGTPRIVGELGKLGVNLAKSTVDKYRVRSGKAPSSTWKTFLKNHIDDLVSIDFLIVPTIRFKLLYVLIVLAHSRRRVLHFNVTANPTAQWTAQQVVEAFPWESVPKYLLRDRDTIYGGSFESGFTPGASSKSSARREVLGKIRLLNDLSARYDATVSIMLSH
jgi:hypothetical protein